MTRIRNAGTVIAAIAALAGAVASAGAAPAGIAWTSDFRAAVAQAKRLKKPLLVEFYADWCGPCQEMARTTFTDPEVIKVSRRFVAVRVDLDKAKDLKKKYRVTSIPHAVIQSPTGAVVREAVGFRDARGFSLFMKQGLPN